MILFRDDFFGKVPIRLSFFCPACYNRGMETAILRFFESIRSGFLTPFFGFFSLFGEAATIALVVILLYWLLAGRAGEQIAVTLLTSLPVNVIMKHAIARPRPYAAGVVSRVDVDNFLVSTRNLGDALSFPSGHAQFTTCLSSSISFKARRWWVWGLSLVFVLLVACSRLYFGVHYPTDVLAGFLLGILATLVWDLIYRYACGARYFVLCGLAIVSLLSLLLYSDKDCVQAAGLLAGVAFFLPICDFLKFHAFKPPFLRRLLRVPAGVLVVGAVFALTLLFPDGAGFGLLKWFLFAGAATLGAQALFRVLKI